MSSNRLTSRAAAVALCSAALAVGAAGAASAATTSTNAVNANTVSVTFTTDEWADLCAAALTPTSYAPTLAAKFSTGNLSALLTTLNDQNVILLKNGIFPSATPSLLGPSTVTASGVPSNVYALVTYCTSSKTPGITTLTVGDPIQAASGSIQSLLANGTGVAQLSSALTTTATR